jgi:hypothetical protein
VGRAIATDVKKRGGCSEFCSSFPGASRFGNRRIAQTIALEVSIVDPSRIDGPFRSFMISSVRYFTPVRVYAAFLLFSLVVYFPSFDNPFRQDDFAFLRYASTVGARGVFEPTTHFSFYRPGALAVFALERALFGEHSGAYILFNYLLHVAISLGMWLVLRRMGLGGRGSFLASGLFVLGVGHYGKKIMWASTSGPLTSVIFSLTAIILMLDWLDLGRRRPSERGIARCLYPLGVSIAVGLAPLFHEASLFTIPVILAVVLIYGPKSWSRRIRFATPVLMVLSAWLVVFKVVSNAYPAYRLDWETVLRAPAHFVKYLGFMLLPVQRTGIVTLAGFLGDMTGVAGRVQVALGIAGTLVLMLLVLKATALWRAMSAWLILWLIPFTSVRMPEGWLELRYLYFASMPFCGLLGYGFDVMTARGVRPTWFRYAAVAGLVCMTVVLVILLERQYDRAGG